jgi:diguanylate cyclase (GGDEF)-like protein
LRVASGRGVLEVEQGRLRTLHDLSGDAALSLLVGGDGRLWVGARGRVHVLEGGRDRRLPLPADASNATVELLAEESGRVWAGSSQGLFLREGDRWVRFADPQLGHAVIGALKADRDGNLWAGTDAMLYRLRGGAIAERIPAKGALQTLRTIYEDREANLWFGSYVEGVSRVWNGWTRRYSTAEGLGNPLLWSVAAGPDGRIWTAGEDGVDVLENGRFRHLVSSRELPGGAAYSLLVEPGQTWIGTRDGARRYRNGRLQAMPALRAMSAAQVNGIVRDSRRRLWFATSRGLFQLRGDGTLAQYAEAAGLADPRTRVLRETRDGRLLVGTQSGLYEFRDGRIRAIPLAGTGLDAPHITALYELPGGQWLAGVLSEEALLLYDGRHWKLLGRDQNVPVNAPLFIDRTDDGYLWVGGLRGIYRVPVADLLAAARDPHYQVRAQTLLNERGDRHGGQKGDCCNGAGNSRGFMKDGAIWLPTRDGIVAMDTGQRFVNAYAPVSLIERVQVGQQWREADPGANWPLPRQARDLRFEFTTLSFQAADNVDIRYRLVGYDDGWRLLENPQQRSATYTNLPAGHYVFEAIGSNNSGVPGRAAARLAFDIAPYFYETPWFYALLAIALLALLWLSNHWMLRRHLRRRAELEKLVQQRTRDLRLANQRLETISMTDPLTGLHNRRYLSRQIPLDLAYYRRNGTFAAGDTAMVFALLDIDHFKSINDTHGHLAGDDILQQVSALLRGLTREGDYLARWGGEEFLLAFRPLPRSELQALGLRICTALAGHRFDIRGEALTVTASLGLMEYPPFAASPQLLGWEQLVSLADRALYQVKRHGRNGWASYRAAGLAPPEEGAGLLRRDLVELIRGGYLKLDGPHHPQTPAQDP